MSNTALITGASSGMGREFARIHAAKGGDLIIVARREAPLEELKQELEAAHGVKVKVIVQDVGTADLAKALYQKVKTQPIDILINNAGFGGHGFFHERDLDREIEMINLNVTALTTLTHLVANKMIKQGGGKILNVGSTAGFVPGPLEAVYYATKAYVVSFSQAIDQELRRHNVTSTVLAPGFVETDFIKVGNLEGAAATKGAADPVEVARKGYAGMEKGKLVVISSWSLKILMEWIIPLMPRRMWLKANEAALTKG